MRLASFTEGSSKPRFGIVRGDNIIDVVAAADALHRAVPATTVKIAMTSGASMIAALEDLAVAAERAKTFSVLFPEACLARQFVDVETAVPNRDDALLTMVTGWMSHVGPTTAVQLGGTLGISASEISNACSGGGSFTSREIE